MFLPNVPWATFFQGQKQDMFPKANKYSEMKIIDYGTFHRSILSINNFEYVDFWSKNKTNFDPPNKQPHKQPHTILYSPQPTALCTLILLS